MAMNRVCGWLVVVVALGGLGSRELQAGFLITEGAGPEVSSIQTAVSNFRAALGALNPNNGSAFSSGRREINWDGVPDTLADPNLLPADFFNSSTVGGRSRGLQLATPGTGFLVTADSSNPTSTAPGLGFSSDFRPFSAERLFTPVGSVVTDVTFFVPGTGTTPAAVSAFGVVFSDLEIAGLTKVELFGVDDTLLLSRNVLSESASGGFSFLGVQATGGERIARVRITTGDIVVFGGGVFGGGSDTVLMDDFIYAEPLAVPEPATALLLCGAAAGLVWIRRRQLRV